jgi:hypothetical protein
MFGHLHKVVFWLLAFIGLSYIAIPASQALAGTQSITIEVGGKTIHVPSPAGFHEISELSPDTRKLSETMVPSYNRLLAVFVSESDLGRIMKGEPLEFEQYMFLQVYRKVEHTNVSGSQFKQFVGQFKQENETLLERVKDRIGPLLDDMSGKLSKDYGVLGKLKLGETVPLGIFIEQNDAVGIAFLVKSQVSVEGQQIDVLMASGMSYIRVKGKILFAYVHSNYETQNNLEWVRTTSRKWVDQILATNVEQHSVINMDSSYNDMVYHRDEANGFAIWYPKTWAKGPTTYEATKLSVVSNSGAGGDDFNVVVVSDPAFQNITGERMVEMWQERPEAILAQLRKSYPDAKVIEKGKTSLDNKPAYYVIFDGTFRSFGLEVPMRILQIFAVYNGRAYYLTSRTGPDEFDDMKPVFTLIMGGFKFLQMEATDYKSDTSSVVSKEGFILSMLSFLLGLCVIIVIIRVRRKNKRKIPDSDD